jgi:transposase InsO family protein
MCRWRVAFGIGLEPIATKCLTLSRRHRRLVQPQGPGVAAADHAVGRLLHRGPVRALVRHGRPEIFNSDEGSQFTSADVVKVLKKAEIAIERISIS